jgi:hypothetical protein
MVIKQKKMRWVEHAAHEILIREPERNKTTSWNLSQIRSMGSHKIIFVSPLHEHRSEANC